MTFSIFVVVQCFQLAIQNLSVTFLAATNLKKQNLKNVYFLYDIHKYIYINIYMGDSMVDVRDIHSVFFKFVAAKKVTDKF